MKALYELIRAHSRDFKADGVNGLCLRGGGGGVVKRLLIKVTPCRI